MNPIQKALEFRKAVQIFLSKLDVDADLDSILEVPTMFPAYEVGKAYKTKEIFSYGINDVGDPQLYQVLQDHTSQAEWTPDTAASLYKKIGIAEDGTPQWVQPLGATDAYQKGDKVSHNGKHWVSSVDNNVWEPGVYGWEEAEES